MNNKYIITAAIKGGEEKLHRLSYDLTNLTEGSIDDLIKFIECLDKHSTKAYDKISSNGFCIQKYKFDENSEPEVVNQHDPEQFDTLYNSIEFVEQDTVE